MKEDTYHNFLTICYFKCLSISVREKTHRHSTFQISIILRILVSSYKQFVYRKTLFYYRYLKRRMLVIETGACASCIYNRLMTANGSFMDILCTSRENTGYVSTCYLQYTIVCTYISFLF